MKQKSPAFSGLFLALWILLLSGCTTIRTPEEVAGAFWQSMAAGDAAAARAYATKESQARLKTVDRRFMNTTAEFGELRVKGENATLETALYYPPEQNRPPLSLKTVLRKEEGLWKVDYPGTLETLGLRGTLGMVIEELKNLGEEFSQGLEGSLSELQKELPNLHQQAESMAEQFRKQMEQLSRELEEALRKIQPEKREEKAPEPPTI